MEDLKNLIRREIALYLTGRATTRIGLVDSYDPNTHAAKVRFQPENTLSGWIPVGTAGAGNGFGVHFAPNVDDQVMVHFLEGEHEAGVIGLRLYSDQDRPLNVPAGELWIMQSATSGVQFHGDGKVTLMTASDLTATIMGKLMATVHGDVTATLDADLTATVNGTATIEAATLNLGGAGGAAVARVGDTVSGGVITSGSSKVHAA